MDYRDGTILRDTPAMRHMCRNPKCRMKLPAPVAPWGTAARLGRLWDEMTTQHRVLDAGGYMIIAAGAYVGVALPSIRGRFKVYAPDGAIVGMFRTADEAAAALRKGPR